MKAKIRFKLGVWWCTKDGVTGWGEAPDIAFSHMCTHLKREAHFRATIEPWKIGNDF